MAYANRRDFFRDGVLRVILNKINASQSLVTLSPVFVEPQNINAQSLPRVSYHILDDRKNYVGEDKRFQSQNPQAFVLFAYIWTDTDSIEAGLIGTEVDRVIDLVEKVFENEYTNYTWTDTNGTVQVERITIDDVAPTVDYGQGAAAIQFTGTITYNKAR